MNGRVQYLIELLQLAFSPGDRDTQEAMLEYLRKEDVIRQANSHCIANDTLTMTLNDPADYAKHMRREGLEKLITFIANQGAVQVTVEKQTPDETELCFSLEIVFQEKSS